MKTIKPRYVIIRNEVYRWEEKAPFPPSGKSVMGALEYDRETDSTRCHECGRWFRHLGNHLRGHRRLTSREYKLKHGLLQHLSIAGKRFRDELRERRRNEGAIQRIREAVQSDEKQSRERRTPVLSDFRLATSKNERNACEPQSLFRLKNLIVEKGTIPPIHEIPKELRDTLRLNFGSPTAALKILGIEPSQPVYTKEILIEDLRDFYVLNQRLPRTGEWGKGRLASLSTYFHHFGSILDAYEAAGLALAVKKREEDRARQISDRQKKAWAARSPEERSGIVRGAAEAQKQIWAAIPPEERRERMKEVYGLHSENARQRRLNRELEPAQSA